MLFDVSKISLYKVYDDDGILCRECMVWDGIGDWYKVVTIDNVWYKIL